ETVDLGFDGSEEGFVLHQIEGFGEYPKRRQVYDCKIGVDLDVVRSIENVYRCLERGDIKELEGSDLWSKEVKGMILSNSNPFESEAKESLGCRYCMVGRRILLRKVLLWSEKYKKAAVLRLLSITTFNISLAIQFQLFSTSLFYLVNMSQGQLVGKVGSKNGPENNIKKFKIYVPHFDNSANEMVSVVFFSATRRELGLGLRGQVIVLLALQLVPLNQLQRAGLELDKVFRLFIMGKRSEERVWSRVYSAVRGDILAFVSVQALEKQKTWLSLESSMDQYVFLLVSSWKSYRHYMRQMRGSGIVAMEWRVAVQRHDGIEVRRNWMVTWLVIKAITVQRWHKRFGMIGVITLLYVVSRCNMDQVIMIGGGGFSPRRYVSFQCAFGLSERALMILCNIKDSYCGIEIVLFLKSSFRLWVYWDWRLRELNGKIGIFLSMLIVLRVKWQIWKI
ncbi:hypothetical protein HID58_094832, partial [Brassica napus]